MSYTLNRIKSNRKIKLREFSRSMKRWGVLEKNKQYTSNQIKERLEKLIYQAEINSMPDNMKMLFDYPAHNSGQIVIKSVVNHNA